MVSSLTPKGNQELGAGPTTREKAVGQRQKEISPNVGRRIDPAAGTLNDGGGCVFPSPANTLSTPARQRPSPFRAFSGHRAGAVCTLTHRMRVLRRPTMTNAPFPPACRVRVQARDHAARRKMNRDRIAGTWKQLKGIARQQWGRLSRRYSTERVHEHVRPNADAIRRKVLPLQEVALPLMAQVG